MTSLEVRTTESDYVPDDADQHDERDEQQESMPTRLQFTAPASQLARALQAVKPVADGKDKSGTYDTVRVEVTDSGVVAVTARGPLMMISALVPDADAFGEGAVEVSVATANELVKVCRSKPTSDADVDALMVQRSDAVELELIYGLPICQHRTRRPTATPRQKPQAVFNAVARVVGEHEAAPMLAPSTRTGKTGEGEKPPTQLAMTPAQSAALAKAAHVAGPVRLAYTAVDGRFLARIGGDVAMVFVCNGDDADGSDGGGDRGGDGDGGGPAGPVVDGAVGDVVDAEIVGEEAVDEIPALGPGLRLVEARPIGGVS